MMLMLFAAAQVHGLVVGILDMQADRVLVERAALAEVDQVEHGMAAADDVERGIEDVCRNGHVVSLDSLSFRARSELRCAIAHMRISRFRVWSYGPSRNDGGLHSQLLNLV